MSTIKTEYKKQLDAFCNDNNLLSAEDILRKSQNPSKEEKWETTANSLIEKKENKIKNFRSKSMLWRAAIPAVICFLVISTTTLAATGRLGDLFRNVFKDEKTATLVEDGYYSDVNMVQEDDLFRVNILSVTGDSMSPKVILDVYVKDEEIYTKHDKLQIFAYCLGKEQYENELYSYAPSEAYGVKDAEIENLYHVSLPGYVWLSNGGPTIINVCKIRMGSQKSAWTDYEVDLKYELKIPVDVFYSTEELYFDGLEIAYNDYTYRLTHVLMGYYQTEVIFRYDCDQRYPNEDRTNYDVSRSELRDWYEFVNNLVLVVDGVEYKVTSDNKGYPWYENDYREGEYYHVHPIFPGIEHEDINSVIIRCGDKEYKLK